MVDDVLRYWPIIAFLLTIVIIPSGWAVIRTGLVTRKEYDEQMAAEQKARADGHAELDRRFTLALAGVDRRLIQVETDIKHLPTAEDMSEVVDQCVTELDEAEPALRDLTAFGVSGAVDMATLERGRGQVDEVAVLH